MGIVPLVSAREAGSHRGRTASQNSAAPLWITFHDGQRRFCIAPPYLAAILSRLTSLAVGLLLLSVFAKLTESRVGALRRVVDRRRKRQPSGVEIAIGATPWPISSNK